MAIDFDVEMSQYRDNQTDATIAADIETWLDGLSITTLHSLYIGHVKGFYVCIVVYV